MYGVPKRGCIVADALGQQSVVAIEKKMRGWLISMTSSTLAQAGDAPSVTTDGSHVDDDRT